MLDWSGLPHDIVREVANRIGAVEDFASFRAVCNSWRSAVTKEEWNPRLPQLPWLILAETESSTGSTTTTTTTTTTRGFYNFATKKRYDLNVPETQGRRCWGSAIGWIFTVGTDLQTHLFNPLSHVRIPLPPLTTFEKHPNSFDKNPPYPEWVRRRFVCKACVINRNGYRSSCTANDIVVMAIYGGNRYLAFARPGYESWVSLQNAGVGFQDVVCFNGQIFAIQFDGTLVLCEIEGPDPPKTTTFAMPPDPEDLEGWESIYLVESEGELLMVLRLYLPVDDDDDELYYKTEGFEVYKFDFSTRKWIEFFDLGDRTLFLGSNYSMSVTVTTDFNCKSNSIYFVDDNWCFWDKRAGGRDMGIFNMENWTFEPHYLGDDCVSPFSPPTWVIPRLV